MTEPTLDRNVAVTAHPARYEGTEDESIGVAIRRLAIALGWGTETRGAFANVIPKRARVVIKPNFVLHANQGAGGTLPLFTHPSFVTAAVDEALKADPSEVLVADAPIQSCNFEELLLETGLDRWSERLTEREPRFKGIVDLRRTISEFDSGIRRARENVRENKDYVLFNLGHDSLLEPLTDYKNGFRVTCYDPRLMAKTHSPGNHQYLIAREVLEADVVINLPKLKTHKKAGITGALKNLVGINGNKEYLPHHRIGGSASGGDCYPGSSKAKRALETVWDLQNKTASPGGQRLFAGVARQLERTIRLTGDRIGVEGAWIGNETVPRMTLDLNRILLYGRHDGSLATTVQRQVLNIVDAVVAGQGDGPLAPLPLELGLIIAGRNAAAVDWFGASRLGYEPDRIPLLATAFQEFQWPVARFAPEEIELLQIDSAADYRPSGIDVKHPAGWEAAKASCQV